MGRIWVSSRKGAVRGFALPTVIITAIVMMIVLLTSLQSVASVAASTKNQYYNKLAQEAAESGVESATYCLKQYGLGKWSDASPLTPIYAGYCSGTTACTDINAALSATWGSRCWVLSSGNIRTTFAIGSPQLQNDGTTYTYTVTATVALLKASSNVVVSTKTVAASTKQLASWPSWNQFMTGGSICATDASNLAYCWGSGYWGTNGNNSTATVNDPSPVYTGGVFGGKTVTAIAGDLMTTCAIASGNAYCWGGDNKYYGNLGNNNSGVSQSNVPVAVYTGGALSGKTVKSITVGGYHVCVIASDNKPYCWGENVAGDLGNNTSNTSANPAPLAVYMSGALSGKTVKAIDAGRDHTCVIANDNKGYCWGYGYNGQLGDNSAAGQSSYKPVAVYTGGVLAGKTLLKISTGRYHTCAIAFDNKAYCWGYNSSGQLGNNSTTDTRVPVAVNTSGALSGKTIVDIAAGYNYTCALASDSTIACWGDNSSGQFGNGTTTSSLVPVAATTTGTPMAGKVVSSLYTDVTNNYAIGTCAMTTDKRIYCWGGTGPYGGSSLMPTYGNKSSFTSLVYF